MTAQNCLSFMLSKIIMDLYAAYRHKQQLCYTGAKSPNMRESY